MPLDPSIYGNVGRVNFGAGLSSLLDQQRAREQQRVDQANTLASLAQQQQAGQRAASEYDYLQQQRARAEAEQAQKAQQQQELMGQLTPQQRQLVQLGVPAEKFMLPKEEKPKDWQNHQYIQYQKDLELFKAGLRPAASQAKAPSGYQFTQDGALEPISGGPADIKAQMASQQKSQAAEQAALSSQQVLDQAAMLLQHPGRETATGASYLLGKIPGTSGRGFNSQLETFKAQTFVPMVSALKGMGALSDAEGKKLSASVGALDPEMPEEEFKASLQNIIKYLYDKGKASGLNVVNPLGDAPAASTNYEADKEARYQAWKAQQGR